MARIRSLKPEIWSSPQVMNLSRDARLLFIGLITQADDEGRGTADVRKLSGTIFPGDRMSPGRLQALLTEIEGQGLALLYDSPRDGRLYALPTWRRHQKVDRGRCSIYAEPPSKPMHEDSASVRRVVVESSTTTREGSDRRGSEGRGSDGMISTRARASGARGEWEPTARKLLEQRFSPADVAKQLQSYGATEADVAALAKSA